MQNEKLRLLIEFSYPRKFNIYKALIDNDNSNDKNKKKVKLIFNFYLTDT